ncbi:uncharacterized protein LOC123529343 [Mercenaria mercenaria]|uniref:uncharacterized protein LOC123529343 n=1 Tax=Mercenaria mercenaria TaxID=6596 RepID=UPI001E1DDAB9|nr:uncharacterized protein LOC123529343 [Mercenaria mercenaria]
MRIINMYFKIWILQIGVSHAGEWCLYDGEYDYCSNGCCHEGCCNVPWLVWAIVGGVIGGILFISFIVCLICLCMKKATKQGRVIQPDGSALQPPPYPAAITTLPYPQNLGVYPQQPTYNQQPTAPPAEYPPPYRNLYEGEQPPPLPAGMSSQGQH